MQSNRSATDHSAGCGARLRHAREAAGLSHEQVASRLRVPTRVVHSLEADGGSLLGAPVFVRGQLRSYARLLQVDIEAELASTPVAEVVSPVLISHTHTPRLRRVAEQVVRRAVYIAITAAIAVPVWMATSPHLAGNGFALRPLDLPPAAADIGVASTSPGAAETVGTPSRTPVIASFTPRVASDSGVSLTFKSDSWVQVVAADGSALEQGVLKAGQTRRYAAGEVGRLVIGNAAAVEVTRRGNAIDLTPFSRANVARITLSSDGSLAPAH